MKSKLEAFAVAFFAVDAVEAFAVALELSAFFVAADRVGCAFCVVLLPAGEDFIAVVFGLAFAID